MDSGFRMALLFLALAPSGHAKKEKTRLQEHAIIYVMKTEGKKVNSEETICVSLQSTSCTCQQPYGRVGRMRNGH